MLTNTPLSYTSFFILYVLCFVYIFREFSVIVALGSLTIVHTAFTIFISTETLSILLNNTNKENILKIISLLLIFISSWLNVSALIMLMTLIITMQDKYNATIGTPVRLPPDYQSQFNKFKIIAICLFFLVCILLLLHSYNLTVISSQITAVIVGILSLVITGLSGYQVYIASDISKLKDRSLIGK
jgi:hypothetical protein